MLNYMKWASQSPDLKPIELWDYLDQTISAKSQKSDLWEML